MMVSEFFSHGKKRYNDTYIHIKTYKGMYMCIHLPFRHILLLCWHCDFKNRSVTRHKDDFSIKKYWKVFCFSYSSCYSSTSQSAAMIILNWGVRDSSPGLAYLVSLWCTGTYILLLLLLTTIATINSFKCCIRFY